MPAKRVPPSTRNIRRIDSPKSHGYQVHIERSGTVITKHFSDSRFSSPSAARKAAIAYRDEMLAEVPPPANQRGYRTVPHSNTGEVGISLTHMSRRQGAKKPYLTVSVSPSPGKMINRKFSVERLGYEEAMAQAKAWREEILQQREQRQVVQERRRQTRRKPKVSSPADAASTEPDATEPTELADDAAQPAETRPDAQS
jgi:hypothetical protein